jgi:hypothetical protein
MRGYAKVLPQFWIGSTGRQIRELGSDAQVVALYLITSPHATMIGIYYLPISFITHETGITVKATCKSLRALSEIGFCTYDEAMEYVWVHDMAFYQIEFQLKPSDNRVININESYQKLPNLHFLPAFYEKYKDAFCIENTRMLEGPLEILSSQEHEQEKKQEQNKTLSSLREDVVSGADHHSAPPIKIICPHENIIALYHETLPMCPRVIIWGKTRRGYLKQRWRDNPKHQTLNWWKDYFHHVKQSSFLTGQVPGREGKPAFLADLEWLVRPNNFIKVIEGKYHGGSV